MRLTTSRVLIVLLGVSISCSATAAYGPVLTGRTTFYGGAPDGMSPNSPSYGTSVGSCGYGALDKGQWPNWSVGALANSQPAYGGPTHGCGTCWSITCSDSNPSGACRSSQPTTIVITDNCPECKSKNNAEFDIQANVFSGIADPAFGSVAIDYQQIPCSPPGNIFVDVLDNRGAGGWVRFVLESVAGIGEVTTMDVQTAGSGSWTAASTRFGAVWEVDSMPGAGPYNLRATLSDGTSVSCTSAFSADTVGKVTLGCQAGGASSQPVSDSHFKTESASTAQRAPKPQGPTQQEIEAATAAASAVQAAADAAAKEKLAAKQKIDAEALATKNATDAKVAAAETAAKADAAAKADSAAKAKATAEAKSTAEKQAISEREAAKSAAEKAKLDAATAAKKEYAEKMARMEADVHAEALAQEAARKAVAKEAEIAYHQRKVRQTRAAAKAKALAKAKAKARAVREHKARMEAAWKHREAQKAAAAIKVTMAKAAADAKATADAAVKSAAAAKAATDATAARALQIAQAKAYANSVATTTAAAAAATARAPAPAPPTSAAAVPASAGALLLAICGAIAALIVV